jgi:hypothetical protein
MQPMAGVADVLRACAEVCWSIGAPYLHDLRDGGVRGGQASRQNANSVNLVIDASHRSMMLRSVLWEPHRYFLTLFLPHGCSHHKIASSYPMCERTHKHTMSEWERTPK